MTRNEVLTDILPWAPTFVLVWLCLAGNTVHLDLTLCVVLKISQTSSALPHSAAYSLFGRSHFNVELILANGAMFRYCCPQEFYQWGYSLSTTMCPITNFTGKLKVTIAKNGTTAMAQRLERPPHKRLRRGFDPRP